MEFMMFMVSYNSVQNGLVYFKCLYIHVHEPGHEKICLMSYANNKGAD